MVGTSSTKARAGKIVGVLKEERGSQNVRITVSGGQSAVNEVRGSGEDLITQSLVGFGQRLHSKGDGTHWKLQAEN